MTIRPPRTLAQAVASVAGHKFETTVDGGDPLQRLGGVSGRGSPRR
jgi:hypothetical protein